MRSTHGSAILSVRAREITGRVSGWRGHPADVCCRVERRRLTAMGLQPAPSPISGGTAWVPRLHPRCRRVPPNRVELHAKGRAIPPPGNSWPAWDLTLTCDADHGI